MHSQVIEYASDLREFWKRGYGHDINSKASCSLFHDVFNRLNRAASENRQVNMSNSYVLNIQYHPFYQQRMSCSVFILRLLSDLLLVYKFHQSEKAHDK